jgi:hypothetical protein
VSIQFSEIHNLVRTYQRVLKLDAVEPPTEAKPGAPGKDRVSISREARELRQVAGDEESPTGGGQAGV